MPSTFFGLNIASSGLSAYQVALNTTANNIANVQTTGYSRQQSNRVASDALLVHQQYGAVGTGVTTVSVKQIRNQYYDTKYWYNQSSVGLYETKLSYLQQIENYFIDDSSSKGFTTILNTMFNSLDTLKNNASDVNTRQQFIGSAQNLATYFNSVSEGLTDIQKGTNDEIKSTVQNINAIAEKIAVLNKQINVIEIQGGYANELRDQRALLIDELSEIVPTEVSEVPITDTNHPDEPTGANYYTVKIGGQVLVDTYNYETLECKARDYKVNQTDAAGLYDIKWSKTGNTFNAGGSSMSGTLKALFDIRDGNNGENFSGLAKVLNSTEVQITNPSITSIVGVSMPEEGILTINGREYAYEGFTFEQDADGNIKGVDLDGNSTSGYAFFTGTDTVTGEEFSFDGKDANGNAVNGSGSDTYYKLTAANICVNSMIVKDPTKLATTVDINGKGGVDAYDLVEELATLKSGKVLYRGGTADGFLKCMIADISVDTQQSEIFSKNYQNVASAIDTQRMSISGVDEDEEAMDLIKFQNAYNLSSKMVSVMAEIYDRLILETGV